MAQTRATGSNLGNPIPASALRRGIGIPVFRCDYCGRWMNDKYSVDYDGMKVCKPFCMTITTPSELDELWAEQQSQVDSWESNERPVEDTGYGIVGINSRTPEVVDIGTSASETVTIEGFGLSSADTIAFQVPEIEVTNATYTGTASVVVEITTTACPAGDYWMSYGGVKYWRMIRVR